MLHLIPKEKIDNLSLEMIIYYMFNEYSEIINGYNNDIIPLFREYNMHDSIESLRDGLIKVNSDNVNNGNDTEDEKIFVDSIIGMYNDLIKEKKSVEAMKILSDRIRTMKEDEIDFTNEEKANTEEIISNLNMF